MVTFGLLACVGMPTRRRPETHKRLLVMSTIVRLGAALVRLLALVTSTVRPWNIAVTAFLVAGVTVYDLRTKHRVHAATLWGGGAVLTNLSRKARWATPTSGWVWHDASWLLPSTHDGDASERQQPRDLDGQRRERPDRSAPVTATAPPRTQCSVATGPGTGFR